MNVLTRVIGMLLLGLLLVSETWAAEEDGELHVTVHLHNGAKIEGIVRSGLETLVDGSFRSGSDASNPRVGYRIWYTTGTNGFIFVPHRDIVRIENRGAVTSKQREALLKTLAQLKEAAEQGRRRARDELVSLEQRQQVDAEEEKASGKAKEEEAEQKKADEAARKRKAVLDRFSPPDWTPDRRATIERNRTVLGLPPSAEEQAWLDSYDLWKQAYDEWEKSEKSEKAEEK